MIAAPASPETENSERPFESIVETQEHSFFLDLNQDFFAVLCRRIRFTQPIRVVPLLCLTLYDIIAKKAIEVSFVYSWGSDINRESSKSKSVKDFLLIYNIIDLFESFNTIFFKKYTNSTLLLFFQKNKYLQKGFFASKSFVRKKGDGSCPRSYPSMRVSHKYQVSNNKTDVSPRIAHFTNPAPL